MESIPNENEKNNLVKKKFLSKRGYGLLKSEWDEKYLLKLKRKLTVKPFVNNNYGSTAPSFKVYFESNKKIYLPKHFGYNNIGEPNKININYGKTININFKGEMRSKQKPVVDAFLLSCNEDDGYIKSSRGGIVSVPCGFGKTVIALYLIAQLKKKTLVIVHKEFLVNQWKERILQYLPACRIGVIQGSKININDCDVVIGMLQSISMKDYPEEIF